MSLKTHLVKEVFIWAAFDQIECCKGVGVPASSSLRNNLAALMLMVREILASVMP